MASFREATVIPQSTLRVDLAFPEPQFRRALLSSLLVALAYYITAKLGFEFTFQPGSVSTLWMPNALLLAGLLLTQRRWWWLVIVVTLPAHLASELLSGVPTSMVLSWFISNSTQALLGAFLLNVFIDDKLNLRRSKDLIAFFILGAFLSPFIASFLDAALVEINRWGNNSYWDIWRLRFLSNVLAVLILVPFVFEWVTLNVDELKKTRPAKYVEMFLFIIMLFAAGIVVFNTQQTALQQSLAKLYWPLPFLVWAAIRFGLRGVSTGLLLVMFLAIYGATHGSGPFLGGTSANNALTIQGFLVFVAVPLLMLASVIEEREAQEASVRQSEERLLRSTRQIRMLAAQLITAQESERRRIAILLHDEVGQNVAALGLALSRLKRRLRDSEPMLDEVDQLGVQVNRLTKQVRELSHELHPEVLQLGLVAALESHVAEMDNDGRLKISFTCKVETDHIPPDIAVCLYRIALEAMRNVSLHSGSNQASLALTQSNGFLVLEVTDSGNGFDIEKMRRGSGLGLASSEERVKLLNGSLDIRSVRNVGTSLTARVPIAG